MASDALEAEIVEPEVVLINGKTPEEMSKQSGWQDLWRRSELSRLDLVRFAEEEARNAKEPQELTSLIVAKT